MDQLFEEYQLLCMNSDFFNKEKRKFKRLRKDVLNDRTYPNIEKYKHRADYVMKHAVEKNLRHELHQQYETMVKNTSIASNATGIANAALLLDYINPPDKNEIFAKIFNAILPHVRSSIK